jgi:hypothetical protein
MRYSINQEKSKSWCCSAFDTGRSDIRFSRLAVGSMVVTGGCVYRTSALSDRRAWLHALRRV